MRVQHNKIQFVMLTLPQHTDSCKHSDSPEQAAVSAEPVAKIVVVPSLS